MTDLTSRERFQSGPTADAATAGGAPGAQAIPLPEDGPEDLVEMAEAAFAPATSAAAAAVAAQPETVIEASRALALADFDAPQATPAEALMRLAYRLGVPGHALTSPFRKPPRPRLLATVESPHRGDRVAGMALRAGHFLIHGVKAPIAQVDFGPAAKLAHRSNGWSTVLPGCGIWKLVPRVPSACPRRNGW